jgi:hypothetical protein
MAMINVGDYSFRPLTEVYVDPLEIVAIGLKLGQKEMDKCIARAKARGVREYAIIGNHSVRVSLHPPSDMRPDQGWLHEFVKPKYLARAREYVLDSMPQAVVAREVEHIDLN